jgi:MazG family protein
MATLRSPEGCPWDREQTPRTLRPFLLEEAYEALDAIDRGDFDELKGELGDVLFQCVFHSQIAAERGRFDIADSIQSVVDKLIRRHPHVFHANGRPLSRRQKRGRAGTPKAVLQQWEQLKAQEQAAVGREERVLSGIPRALPSLLRAHEIGSRVAAVGFDWNKTADVIGKIEEEVRELREALQESPARAAEELGDLLFSLANLARKLDMEPESALREANDKFTRRFDQLEAWLAARGRSVHGTPLTELEEAWQAVKILPASGGTPARSARTPTARRPPRRRSRLPRRRRDQF